MALFFVDSSFSKELINNLECVDQQNRYLMATMRFSFLLFLYVIFFASSVD